MPTICTRSGTVLKGSGGYQAKRFDGTGWGGCVPLSALFLFLFSLLLREVDDACPFPRPHPIPSPPPPASFGRYRSNRALILRRVGDFRGAQQDYSRIRALQVRFFLCYFCLHRRRTVLDVFPKQQPRRLSYPVYLDKTPTTFEKHTKTTLCLAGGDDVGSTEVALHAAQFVLRPNEGPTSPCLASLTCVYTRQHPEKPLKRALFWCLLKTSTRTCPTTFFGEYHPDPSAGLRDCTDVEH